MVRRAWREYSRLEHLVVPGRRKQFRVSDGVLLLAAHAAKMKIHDPALNCSFIGRGAVFVSDVCPKNHEHSWYELGSPGTNISAKCLIHPRIWSPTTVPQSLNLRSKRCKHWTSHCRSTTIIAPSRVDERRAPRASFHRLGGFLS